MIRNKGVYLYLQSLLLLPTILNCPPLLLGFLETICVGKSSIRRKERDFNFLRVLLN